MQSITIIQNVIGEAILDRINHIHSKKPFEAAISHFNELMNQKQITYNDYLEFVQKHDLGVDLENLIVQKALSRKAINK